MRIFLAKCALWMADRSNANHIFWNDVADAISTHRTLAEVRAARVGGPD